MAKPDLELDSGTPEGYRYRSRNDNSVAATTSSSYFQDKVVSTGSWGAIPLLEETWDRETVWPRIVEIVRDYRSRGLKPPNFTQVDCGAPFINKKVRIDMGARYFNLAQKNTSFDRYYGYDGFLVAGLGTATAVNTVVAQNAFNPSTTLGLDAMGATAIARCAPASPHASAYTAIGEIYRDGLPSIPGLQAMKGKKRPAKDIGGEYLNVEFGIVPTISDIRNLSTAAWNAQRILRQYSRDAGRNVRRSYSFPVENNLISRTVTSNTYPVGGANATVAGLWASKGETIKTITETKETWFSGCFTYDPLNVHKSGDFLSDHAHRLEELIRKANVLFGVLPTSAALWQLSPWSWAADWVTNIGDVLTNISMFQTDGLMMRWGYVMEHKLRTVEYHHRGSVAKLYGGGTQPVDLTQRLYIETKRRRAATPFGFGFELNGLSGRQEAILVALGAAKL